MLKVRLMGTVAEIKWFQGLMLNHPEIQVMDMSGLFTNRGTSRFFRSYAELERAPEDITICFQNDEKSMIYHKNRKKKSDLEHQNL